MAPDLNTLPPSPHTTRTVPPLVAPVPNILPSNTSAILAASQPSSPAMPVHTSTAGDNSAVGGGPGPVRHPRPMTAAELHSQLEREQEAVVRISTSAVGTSVAEANITPGQPSYKRAFNASRCPQRLRPVKPLIRLWLRPPRGSRHKPRQLRPILPSTISSSRKPWTLLILH